MGIKSPVVDDLVEKIIEAESREHLVTAAKALDRVLLWGEYIVPQWHFPYDRVVYWTPIQRPESDTPLYQLDLEAWWMGEPQASEGQSSQVQSSETQSSETKASGTDNDSVRSYILWLLAGLLLMVVLSWFLKNRTRQGR